MPNSGHEDNANSVEIVGSPPAVGAAALRLLPWLIAVAFFMESLDTTILNTGVPAIFLPDRFRSNPAEFILMASIARFSCWVE